MIRSEAAGGERGVRKEQEAVSTIYLKSLAKKGRRKMLRVVVVCEYLCVCMCVCVLGKGHKWLHLFV